MRLPKLRSHGLLPVDHYACCALRIDRRLGTFAAHLRDRPASGIFAYGPVKGASKDAPHIAKPVSMDVLLSAMEDLLAGPARVSWREHSQKA